MSTSRRRFLSLLGLAPVGAVLAPKLPSVVSAMAGHLPWQGRGEGLGIGELSRQARANNMLNVLTYTPDGAYSLIQISGELFEQEPKISGQLWAHHLTQQLQRLRERGR